MEDHEIKKTIHGYKRWAHVGTVLITQKIFLETLSSFLYLNLTQKFPNQLDLNWEFHAQVKIWDQPGSMATVTALEYGTSKGFNSFEGTKGRNRKHFSVTQIWNFFIEGLYSWGFSIDNNKSIKPEESDPGKSSQRRISTRSNPWGGFFRSWKTKNLKKNQKGFNCQTWHKISLRIIISQITPSILFYFFN